MNARAMAALSALALCMAWTAPAAPSGDPPLKPGRDPGGVAVAILADGFDYTQPELAAVLARDGEGEAIAWDAVDEDGRPFLAEGRGTAEALAVAGQGGARIVQVRVDKEEQASLARGIAFAAQTPARIVFAPHAARDAEGRAVLAAAAEKFAHVLFVAASPNWEPDQEKANLLVLAPDAQGLTPATRIARALGCGRDAPEATGGADLKRALLSRLEETPPAPCQGKAGDKRERQP